MKRVLLTGASGFIGRHCLVPLCRAGYEVHAVARRPLSTDVHLPVVWHEADLLDSQTAAALIHKVSPTHLLHLAWIATPGIFWTSPQNLHWVESSLRLLREFAEHGGRRAVCAGTCAEFDWTRINGPCNEETPLRPSSLYGTCKNALRQLLHGYAGQVGLSSAWGRIFFLYGPHEHSRRLIPSAINALIRRAPLACTHGEQQRDFMHVQDGADAFTALLDSDVQGDVNLGTGQGHTLRDVVGCLTGMLKGNELIQWGVLKTPQHEPRFLVADATRLRGEVMFSPRFELADGVNDTVTWWQQNRHNDIPSAA